MMLETRGHLNGKFEFESAPGHGTTNQSGDSVSLSTVTRAQPAVRVSRPW